MSKARTLANLISDNSVLADGQIAVAEVTGAAPLASPTFSGNVTTTGSFIVGNASLNENDLESIDGITAGTVAASKAVVVNSNKDASGFRNISLTGTVDGVDIATRDAVLTSTTTTANAALPKSGGAMTGAITTNSTFDGRDIATDGTKLDTIATNANNYTHPNHSGEVTSSADGATVIADNVVDEANLKISNTPTNGYVLTAQSGNTGGLTWAEAASGADLYAANDVNATAPSATGNNSVAIGPSSEANSADATAFGYRSEAKASKAVAIGEGRAGGSNATAISIGTTSTAYGATGSYSVAMGYQAKATGTYAFALGPNSVSTGQESFAIGKSLASGANSFAAAIDNNTTSYGASGANSIAIGKQAKANRDPSIALGQQATATGTGSQAFGYMASATGNYSTAIGLGANANQSDQIAIGGTGKPVKIAGRYTLPTADGTNGQVMTSDGNGVVAFADAGGGADLYAANESSPDAQPSATGANAIAIGEAAVASGSDAFAVGSDTDATGTMSMALGKGAQATANYNLAIGLNANATGERAVGIGNNGIIAGSAFSTAIGHHSGFGGSVTATGAGAMALGGSRATGVDSFAAAIANNTASYGASGANSIAIGKQAKSTAGNAVAIGSKATASSASSMSFCTSYANYGNVSSALNSFTMGDGNSASATSAIATGYGANANIQGKHAHANGSFGDGNAEGSAQRGTFVLRCDTTDATAEALRTSNGTASTNNQITLPNNSAYTFSGTIVAREKASEGTDVGSWEVKGIIRREANAGTTVLVNSVINEFNAPTGWAVALTADTTNGCLKVAVTGVASTNIRWVATINTSEVTYA